MGKIINEGLASNVKSTAILFDGAVITDVKPVAGGWQEDNGKKAERKFAAVEVTVAGRTEITSLRTLCQFKNQLDNGIIKPLEGDGTANKVFIDIIRDIPLNDNYQVAWDKHISKLNLPLSVTPVNYVKADGAPSIFWRIDNAVKTAGTSKKNKPTK